MKKFYLLIIIAWVFLVQTVLGGDQLSRDDVVAITGDSITQAGYPLYIEAYLNMCYNQGPVRTIKFGWPGDSMGSFWGRKCGADPVLSFRPTIVTTLYGMNDAAYRKVDENTVRRYRNGLVKMIEAYKKNDSCKVIIGSPTAVDTTTYPTRHNLNAKSYNDSLALLVNEAEKVAKEYDCRFINIHDLMLQVMAKAKAKYGKEYHVAGQEGVHPSTNGLLVIAYAFLKELGCDGDIGTITYDIAGDKATASDHHKILNCKDRIIEIESSRYPFCFKGEPNNPGATSGIIEFFPFNKDLNRFQLVIKGLKSDAHVRVTWGAVSKDFEAAKISRGINLAEEFIDNPFSKSFRDVFWIIVDQKSKWEYRQFAFMLADLPKLLADMKKDPETLDKTRRNDIKQILEVDPDAGRSLERLKAAILKKDKLMAEKVAAAVVPVVHQIKIELVDK